MRTKIAHVSQRPRDKAYMTPQQEKTQRFISPDDDDCNVISDEDEKYNKFIDKNVE